MDGGPWSILCITAPIFSSYSLKSRYSQISASIRGDATVAATIANSDHVNGEQITEMLKLSWFFFFSEFLDF